MKNKFLKLNLILLSCFTIVVVTETTYIGSQNSVANETTQTNPIAPISNVYYKSIY